MTRGRFFYRSALNGEASRPGGVELDDRFGGGAGCRRGKFPIALGERWVEPPTLGCPDGQAGGDGAARSHEETLFFE